MNTVASLGSSHFLPHRAPEALHAAADTPRASKTQSSRISSTSDTVSLSDAGLELSKRANDLGNAAIDFGQDLVTSFAKQIFGDAAEGMKIFFDSASVSAMSQFSAAMAHSAGPDSTTDAAAMMLQDAAYFTGKGQITTADGHRYTFAVEVHYQSTIEAGSAAISNSTSTDNKKAVQTQQEAQPAQDINVKFPGTISDLMHMLDQDKLNTIFQFPSTGDADARPQYGNLMLQLLDLVESPPPIVKKLADAYGSP